MLFPLCKPQKLDFEYKYKYAPFVFPQHTQNTVWIGPWYLVWKIKAREDTIQSCNPGWHVVHMVSGKRDVLLSSPWVAQLGLLQCKSYLLSLHLLYIRITTLYITLHQIALHFTTFTWHCLKSDYIHLVSRLGLNSEPTKSFIITFDFTTVRCGSR